MRRETKTSGVALGVIVALGCLAAPSPAWAERAMCFRVQGESAAASAGRAQHVVGLATVFRLSSRCEYSTGVSGPWVAAGRLAERDTDFLELLDHILEGAPRSERAVDPRFIFARVRSSSSFASDEAPQHTLILRYCAHYLLEESLGFSARPVGAEGGVVLERDSGPSASRCQADELELRAVEGAVDVQLSRSRRDPARTLEVGERRLELPEGEWAIYAARPGGRVGLRVGVFRATSVTTPLRRHLRALSAAGEGEGPPPLLAARWPEASSGLALAPTPAALDQPLLWAELRTAADAGLVWLARTAEGGGAPRVLGAVSLEGSRPPTVRFPDRPVREYMERRYGAAGGSMAPDLDDWSSIFDDLSICLTPSYLEQQTAAVGAPAPDPSSCAALASLISLEAPEAGGAARPRVCIERGVQIQGAHGARREVSGEPTCFDLPGLGEPMPFHVAVVDDRLTLSNAPGACVLIDNEPLVPRGEEWVLERSGLLEVRVGGGEGCMSGQALSRLRLPVVDPQREWHPVGLGGAADDEDAACLNEEGEDQGGRCPWRALRHDEDEVFAYVRSRHALEFRFSTSPAVAAAINRSSDAEVLLSQDVPLLSGVEGSFEGARSPGLVAFLSRDGQCPSGEGQSVAELRAQAPLEPDGEIVDRIFHVFLASVEGEDRPPHCLSRATFRVRPSRALVTASAGEMVGLEIGVLGDVQAVFFVAPQPLALGVALPVAYLRLNLFPIRRQRWLALELAGNLVFAASFDPAGVSRTGASLSAALQLGVPRWVPRLLSVGVMLNGAFEGVPEDPGEDNNPIWGVYLGLDLSTLVDLAGGR